MPESLYDIQRRFRTALLQRERAAAAEMVRHYGDAYRRIHAALLDLLARADAARAAGQFSPSWVHQQRRLETLEAQVLAEVHAFAAFAGDSITAQQRQAAYEGAQDAARLVQTALDQLPLGGDNKVFGYPAGVGATFARLPTGAAQDLVGTLQDGSPLRALLDGLGPQASDGARKALVSGLAAGLGPRVVAREVRRALGVPLTRALTIARTETLRAYRTSAIATYRANADVVDRWEWVCARSSRTCAVCLAMDGRTFPLDEVFASHPNCRCAPVPVTKSWAELGVAGLSEPPRRETGAEWLARQDAATQDKILGRAKGAAYRAGEISLADLVDYRDDPRWGPGRSEKSLAEALRA